MRPVHVPRALPPAALALLSLALAGCLGLGAQNPLSGQGLDGAEGIAALDVALPGPLEVVQVDYDFGTVVMQDPRMGHAYPVHMIGEAWFPTPQAGDGPFPVVLLLHGRHGTCDDAVFGEHLNPIRCPDAPPVMEPVDSYRGYGYLGEQLASHGFVVASLNANEINDHDEPKVWACLFGVCDALFTVGCTASDAVCDAMMDTWHAVESDHGTEARADLLLRTLDRFAELNQGPDEGTFGDALVGRVDLERVGLLGHSRGGEGVTRAVTANRERAAAGEGAEHGIQAVFALAPSDFARWTVPDVAWTTLLPRCDGDVFNQHGAWVYDDSRFLQEEAPRPRTQLIALGANHNWYNTVWWQDDASFRNMHRGDPACGPAPEDGGDHGHEGNGGLGATRLTAEDQRRHLAAYAGGFFRWHLAGASAYAPWQLGASPPPEAACPLDPAPQPACDARFLTSYHAPAPLRLVVEDTLEVGDAAPATNDLGGAHRFEGFAAEPRICAAEDCTVQPNWATAPQLELAWDASGATWTTGLPEPHRDVSRFDGLSLRVGVGFAPDVATLPGASADVRLAVRDAAGREATLRLADVPTAAPALQAPPGGDARSVLPTMAWVPLAAFASQGVDLGAVAEVAVVFDAASGNVVTVTDLQFQALPLHDR